MKACNVIAALLLVAVLQSNFKCDAYYTTNNVLIMDHLNINHPKGRHDLVKCFYVETMGLTLDARKQENIDKGRKTLWANAGITQFHLPEADNAQVFDGIVTLAYKDKSCIDNVMAKLKDPISSLRDDQSLFSWSCAAAGFLSESILVTDPWGSKFRLVVDPIAASDIRGCQPGASSSVCAMSDLCVHIPQGTPLEGIRRFCEQIFHTTVLSSHSATASTSGHRDEEGDYISIVVSPQQTLTFKHSPSPLTTLEHQ